MSKKNPIYEKLKALGEDLSIIAIPITVYAGYSIYSSKECDKEQTAEISRIKDWIKYNKKTILKELNIEMYDKDFDNYLETLNTERIICSSQVTFFADGEAGWIFSEPIIIIYNHAWNADFCARVDVISHETYHIYKKEWHSLGLLNAKIKDDIYKFSDATRKICEIQKQDMLNRQKDPEL